MTVPNRPRAINGAQVNGAVQAVNGVNGGSPNTTNGVPPANSHVNDTKHIADVTIPLNDIPAYTPLKKLRVVTIGAGYSGLTLAHKLQHQHSEMQDKVEHTIFEARPDIGGTWLANTYPGVMCDVPSHIYVCGVLGHSLAVYSCRIPVLTYLTVQAFPFNPNPEWSAFYSTGPEIHEYMRKMVEKWNLDRDVQLNTRVVGAYWQEVLGQWKLVVQQEGIEREEYADILISGQGFLKYVQRLHEVAFPDEHLLSSSLWAL